MNIYYVEIDFGEEYSRGRYKVQANNISEALILAIIRVGESLRDKIKKIYFI